MFFPIGTGVSNAAYLWSWVLLGLAFVVTIVAQARVSSTYAKFSKIGNRKGITGARMAELMLEQNGVTGMTIQRVAGKMTDHFNPANNTINLSEGVYAESTIAALAIAAHECGHVLQKTSNYSPMVVRGGLVPIVNVLSKISFPLILIGIIFSFNQTLIDIGIWLYFAVVIFQVVTLPVEFNASRRAMQNIQALGVLEGEEVAQAKSMLSAAAMTYVAAMLASFLTFLRLVLLSRRR